ncbi:MAG TPA: S1-like domain-containing RNA-binding protein, partial [Kofleriaceae bacterium]|nr:S1-like domain-containing RNA-binding protein [Kofleriaceae bacterium]
MNPDELLGRVASLPIRRFAAAGAFLALGPEPESSVVLLPGGDVPADAKVGDPVRVFVHLDSEDRPIATTQMPKLFLGEVTFLTVTATTPIGAFVDWGLGKELLVPFA